MSILRDILAAKRERVRRQKRELPWSVLEGLPLWQESRRSLAAALRRDAEIRFLCEIKRASPSAGAIALDADAVWVARRYREEGAAAVSLVTEEDFFRGRPDDLPRLRSLGLPLLMKDFLVDVHQVGWARAHGADAVLLIVATRDRPLLRELRAAARELGLEVLVEVHDERECEEAAEFQPDLCGVNNRDLSSFRVDLGTSEQLLPRLPKNVTRLSESGIRTRADVDRLERAGFDGLLVGEHLMRARDPGTELRTLRGASATESAAS